jgi:hypothetical protein
LQDAKPLYESPVMGEFSWYWSVPDQSYMPALHWWQPQRKDMPHLAIFSRFSASRSSTSSERIFRVLGSRLPAAMAACWPNVSPTHFNHPAAIASRSDRLFLRFYNSSPRLDGMKMEYGIKIMELTWNGKVVESFHAHL